MTAGSDGFMREQRTSGIFEQAPFEPVRAALPDYLRPMLTVGCITGRRTTSELLPMEWRHVDFRAVRCAASSARRRTRRGGSVPSRRSSRLLCLRVQRPDRVRARPDLPQGVPAGRGEQIRYWRRPWRQAPLKTGLARPEVDENGRPTQRGKIIARR